MTSFDDKSDKADARIDLRVPQDLKSLVSRAATIAGCKNLSSFIVNVLRESALRVVEENERLMLSQKEWERFADALENAPEPSPALRESADRYKEDGYQ